MDENLSASKVMFYIIERTRRTDCDNIKTMKSTSTHRCWVEAGRAA